MSYYLGQWMIFAVKADGESSCLYGIFLVHQLLYIKNDNLKLNTFLVQLNCENLVRMLSHVNINSKANFMRSFPEVQLQNGNKQKLNKLRGET